MITGIMGVLALGLAIPWVVIIFTPIFILIMLPLSLAYLGFTKLLSASVAIRVDVVRDLPVIKQRLEKSLRYLQDSHEKVFVCACVYETDESYLGVLSALSKEKEVYIQERGSSRRKVLEALAEKLRHKLDPRGGGLIPGIIVMRGDNTQCFLSIRNCLLAGDSGLVQSPIIGTSCRRMWSSRK